MDRYQEMRNGNAGRHRHHADRLLVCGGDRAKPTLDHPPTATYLTIFVAVGVAITTLIEWLALRGLWLGGWEYSSLMPVIPGIGVGLSPLAQWLVLPLLTAWFVRRQLAAYSHPM